MTYSRYSSILVIFLLAVQAWAYKQESMNINVNGKSRNMVVFTPNELPAKSPLMIITHGMNQDPEYQYGSDKIYEMVDTAKFVVTYLRSDGNTWDVGGTKDQNFVIKAIDEMAKLYDIDRDRVYWSGFSMGSMLIHHCIANMQDKIAAFAPTSGIQFSEQPWNNCKKPVNLLECIAYDDDVFGYEQYGIHAYIENYAKHDKHTQYSKEIGYKPMGASWGNGDLEKWTGGPNGGEVWLYSYNNGGHWPSDQNRHLIWNFCKRFSLNQPTAHITEPAGETTYLSFTPPGTAVFPDVAIEATAKAQSGEVVKAEFYDGGTLLATISDAASGSYSATLTDPQVGKHYLRVVVTDDKEKTAEAACLVSCETPEVGTAYNLSSHFTTEGVVPQDWIVSNGTTERIGGGLSFSSGPRLLHFTHENRAIEYGLLVQNTAGKEKGAYAKFGVKKARSTVMLYAGHYALKYRLYNWNQPESSPVIIAIEDANGEEVASKTYKPTVNIGGKTDKAFQTFEFDINYPGEYVVAFYTDAAKNADFVLGLVSLQAKEYTITGISDIHREAITDNRYYDLYGRRVEEGQLQPGIYILDGRKIVIQK